MLLVNRSLILVGARGLNASAHKLLVESLRKVVRCESQGLDAEDAVGAGCTFTHLGLAAVDALRVELVLLFSTQSSFSLGFDVVIVNHLRGEDVVIISIFRLEVLIHLLQVEPSFPNIVHLVVSWQLLVPVNQLLRLKVTESIQLLVQLVA